MDFLIVGPLVGPQSLDCIPDSVKWGIGIQGACSLVGSSPNTHLGLEGRGGLEGQGKCCSEMIMDLGPGVKRLYSHPSL